MFDAMIAATPFGYNERVYRCPQADVRSPNPNHSAAIEAVGGSVLLHRNKHGDYYCAQCNARIYPDVERKQPFSLGFVVREEWL